MVGLETLMPIVGPGLTTTIAVAVDEQLLEVPVTVNTVVALRKAISAEPDEPPGCHV